MSISHFKIKAITLFIVAIPLCLLLPSFIHASWTIMPDPPRVKIAIHSQDAEAAAALKSRFKEHLAAAGINEKISTEILSRDLTVKNFHEAWQTGLRFRAWILFFRGNENEWHAAFLTAGADSDFTYPILTAMIFREGNPAERFIAPYVDYCHRRFDAALQGFSHWQSRGNTAQGDFYYWAALAMARSGALQKARDYIEEAVNMDFTAGEGAKWEMKLFQTVFSLHRASFDLETHHKCLESLHGCVEPLKEWNPRSGAIAQMATADCLLRGPVEDFDRRQAESLLAEGGRTLRHPMDEGSMAYLMELRATILLRDKENPGAREKAVDLLQKAGDTWKRLGLFTREEALSRSIRLIKE